MSNEINDFISELKKTRDYSGFAPKGFKGHEGKTSKKVEKVASVENTLTHHSDSSQQAVHDVQEDTSIISTVISTILKEDSTQGQTPIEGLNEPSIGPVPPVEVIESLNLERIALDLTDKPKPVKEVKDVKEVKEIKLKNGITLNGSDALNGAGQVYEAFKMSGTFIDKVSEAYDNDRFNFSRKKRNELDDNTYEILMQLIKHQGHIKSVSTLINVVLSDFIKNNKEELQTLFAAALHRINFK